MSGDSQRAAEEVADCAVQTARHDSIPRLQQRPSAPTFEPRLFTGQQSNTSVMLGEYRNPQALPAPGTRPQPRYRGSCRAQRGWHLRCRRPVRLDRGQLGLARAAAGRRSRHGDREAGRRHRRLGAGPGFTSSRERVDKIRLRVCVSPPRLEALGRALAEIHHALRSSFATTRVLGARTAMIMIGPAARGGPDRPGAGATRPRSAALLRRAGCPDLGYPAGARRLPSGPDAAHSLGLEDHRLRGRAGEDNGRAPGSGLGVARRRRDAAFLRLRGREHSGTAERSLGGRVPCCLLARLHGCGVGRDRSEPAPRVRGRQGDL